VADETTEQAGRLRRGLAAAGRRRTLLAAAAASVLMAGALALLLGGAGGDPGAGAAAGASSSVATGAVERRTLAEHLTATGTIGYAGESTVLARLSGTVTALPAVGDVIRRGGRLYALADEPVSLLYGSVPAYRALAEGVSRGPDVEQLERNLAALGYEPGSVDEEFTPGTAAAIAAWQEDLGLEATGELELGRVAFLRGPQRVTKLEATLGEALGAGQGGGEGRMVAWDPEAEDLGQAAEAREPKKKESEPEEETPEPEEEPVPKQEPEGREGPGAKEEPEPEPSSVPVLRTSSTRRVVSVGLEADQQAIAQRGQKVEVLLPGGAEAPGKVLGLAAVESAAAGGTGEGAEPGVEATIAVIGKHRIPALDGATVNVLFTQRVRRDALSVPLTALVAIGGDRFAVRVREPGGRRQIVVTPGLAADGFVEVKGKGLRVGMAVEMGG
jgi:peptidoglycan hydrolase-like protein with peptidoglycan-binding domain